MKTTLKSDFDCVYSINGRIVEGGTVNLDENEVYYITAFPLNAVLLPYTVKTVGGKVCSNNDLCIKVCAKDCSYLMFCKRYSYIYSPTPFSDDCDTVSSFFSFVKQNRIDKARGLLSPALSKSVSDEMLTGFFEKYEYVLKADEEEKWILATKEGEGDYFTFILKHGLIDDISN
ncbi:MAG: hypothetical protein J6C23_07210 [Clostridia bacterium]|nr:hypothetical protein [Clostridia bacterium]